MIIPKNIYKKICKNPECGCEFTCDHGNREYCSVRCKRNFEGDQKRKNRLKLIQDQNEMKKNMDILELYYNTGKTKVSKEELEKKGFNANHYLNRIQSLKGEIIYAYENYFLHRISDKEFIIKKIYHVPRNKHI